MDAAPVTSEGHDEWLCRACGSTEPTRVISLRESMYDSGERFDYALCADCCSLSIIDVPADLGRYYPNDYYAHTTAPRADPVESMLSRVKALLARILVTTRLGGLLSFGVPGYVRWTARAKVPRDGRILDVGSGSGELLSNMAAAGFVDLTGIDPFLHVGEVTAGSVRLLRRELAEVDGDFDLIMMNHSLEHVPRPRGMIQEAADRLAPGGVLLIRIPTVDSFAWEHYGPDWVQLDPPRHLTLFSRRAITEAAMACGLRVVALEDDSNSFQFWGSEERRAGVPLAGPDSRAADGSGRRLLDIRRWVWNARAKRLNRAGRGDSIALYLAR